MQLKLKYLKNFLPSIKIDYKKISKTLTDIGLEVESKFQDIEYKLFITAKIIEAEKHPNADRLKVCKVFDGEKTHQIVCGAKNARAGISVVLALPGAIVPNGNFEIKISKIRDVQSHGMLCSASELCLSEESEGILELDENVEAGISFNNIVDEEKILEYKLTPNRGYASSLYGVSKDLSTAFDLDFHDSSKYEKDFKFEQENPFKLNTISEDIFYQGVYISNLQIKETPKNIKDFIEAFGFNSINTVVDILNYLMIIYGQPMHAYDAEKISKNINIEYKKDLNFKALNGFNYKVNENSLLILGDKNPISIFGIIGSEDSKISESTQNLFLEVAYANPQIIAKSNQTLGIHSDAAFRFERGINFDKTEKVLKIAVNMILEICGGKASEILKNDYSYSDRFIEYDLKNLEIIFGKTIPNEEQIRILKSLDFQIIDQKEDLLNLKIPRYRYYIDGKNQISEEIGRVVAYDNLIESKKEILSENLKFIKNKSSVDIEIKIKKATASLGYKEIISIPFSGDDQVSSVENSIKIINPINKEKSYLRDNILGQIFSGLSMNIKKYSPEEIKLFEVANIFKLENGQKIEENTLGLVHFLKKDKTFSNLEKIKYDLFKILKSSFNFSENQLKITKDEKDALKFNCLYENLKVAEFGIINPTIYKSEDVKDLDGIIYYSTVNISALSKIEAPKKINIQENSSQVIERQFSFIFENNLNIHDIIKKISEDVHLDEIKIVDVFSDKNIGENNRSITLKVKKFSKNVLTSQEIDNQISDKIVQILRSLGGRLRDGIEAR